MTAHPTVKFISFLIITTIFLFLFAPSVSSQSLNDGQIAVNLEVEDTDATAGDILIIQEDDTLVRASSAYDKKIFGVVVADPAIVLNVTSAKTKSIVSSGEVNVKVSNKNGNIEVGDFITSSDEAGVSQKATEEGVVVGKALASYSSSGVGTIPVMVNITFQSGIVAGDINELWDKLIALSAGSLKEPGDLQTLLRYLFAFLLGVGTFVLGFFFFARSLRVGLVAIGRNPLAKGTIRVSMLINLLAITVLSLAGFGLSLAILMFT